MKNVEKLRILFLITDMNKGGAERFLIDLCTELKHYTNIEFIIGALFDNNEYKHLTSKFNIVVLNFKTFSIFGKNENITYKNLLETFKPNIIHTNRFLAEFISSYYVDKNIKYVCHGHDNMVQLKNFSIKTMFKKDLLLNFLEKKYIYFKKYNRLSNYFIANSSNTQNYFQKALPKKNSNNIKLIFYGFNYERFKNLNEKKIENKLLVKILNVSSFSDKKNQVFLLEIALELKKLNINFEMNLIGNGENYEKIKRLITEKKLEGNVFLRGIIDNVEDWYKESDFYVHSAYYEPFGLVFLEAMATGLPVITLDGKGNRDIIEDAKNGFIIYKQDPTLFAKRIESLINNPVLYSEISNYAKIYSSKFNSSIKVKELVDFYYAIL